MSLCKALKGGILRIVTSRFFRCLINSFKSCYIPAHLWHSKTSKGSIQGLLFVFLNFLYLAPQFWKNQERFKLKRAGSAVTGMCTSPSREQGYFHVRMKAMKAAYGKHSSWVCNSLHITSRKTKGLFLACWLISVAIAISNTYKNRVEPKCAKTLAKVLKRQSNTRGVWQSFNGEGCQINLSVVITPQVAVGISGVVSKYVGLREVSSSSGTCFVWVMPVHQYCCSCFHFQCGFCQQDVQRPARDLILALHLSCSLWILIHNPWQLFL